MKNREVLPQWFWENNHPAIIPREKWSKAQELLTSGTRGKHIKPLEGMKHMFTLTMVKTGVLCGYFLLDINWTNDEHEQFINIIKSINELGNSNEEKE